MSETEVWRAILDWLVHTGFSVVCSCPPGGSSLAHARCILADPHGKRDEPDIIFTDGRHLVVVECKPSFEELLKTGHGDSESDVEKLHRVYIGLQQGVYDTQLVRNFGLRPTREMAIIPALGYGSRLLRSVEHVLPIQYLHIIVNSHDFAVSVEPSLHCFVQTAPKSGPQVSSE